MRRAGKVERPPPWVYFSGHGSDVTHPGPERRTHGGGFHALISYATCRLRLPPILSLSLFVSRSINFQHCSHFTWLTCLESLSLSRRKSIHSIYRLVSSSDLSPRRGEEATRDNRARDTLDPESIRHPVETRSHIEISSHGVTESRVPPCFSLPTRCHVF